MANAPYPIRGLGDWWNELRQYINDRPTESKIVDEITDPGSEIGGALNAAYVGRSQMPIWVGSLSAAAGSAASNAQALQDAVDLAQTTGRPVVLPWTASGQYFEIDRAIEVASGDIRIWGQGRYATRLRQISFPTPIWDVTGPRTTIEDMWLDQKPFTVAASDISPMRGEPGTSMCSGVFVSTGADDVTVQRVHGTGLVAVAHWAAWDVAANTEGEPVAGGVCEDVTCENVVFALLAVGTKGLSFSGIRGHYRLLAGITTPPHLVYFSQGLGMNRDVSGSRCHAEGGEYSFAYQLKGVDGGTFLDLSARDTKGLLHVMQSNDLSFTGLRSLGDTAATTYGSIDIEDTNRDIEISGVRIKMSGTGKPVRFDSTSTRVRIKNADITSNHTAAGAPDDYDVSLAGTDCAAEHVTVHNVGTHTYGAGIGVWGGTGHTITAPKAAGNKFGVEVREGASASLVDYDLADLAGTVRGLAIGAATVIHRPRASALASPEIQGWEFFEDGRTASGTFSTPSRTTSGHTWTTVFGTWAVSPGLLWSSVGANACLTATLGTGDVTLSAAIRPKNREALVVRVADRNNLIGARLNQMTGAFEIYKNAAGVSTALASHPMTVTLGRRYDVTLSIYGTAVRATVDDGLAVLTYTLTEAEALAYTATAFGVLGNGEATGTFSGFRARRS